MSIVTKIMKGQSLSFDKPSFYELEQASKADLGHKEVSKDALKDCNISSYPYNCIGLLKFKSPHRETTLNGTAFLIDSDLIVTTADNIYSKQDKCFYKDFQFYPPTTEKPIPIKIRQYRIQDSYIKKEGLQESFNHSLALMKLDRPVFYPHYCQLKYDYFWEQGTVSMYGYPKPMPEHKLFGCQGSLLKIQQNLMIHSINSESGQTGSPILMRIEGRECVIGIQVGCHDHKGVALILAKELMMNICRWERQMMVSNLKFSAYERKEVTKRKVQDYSFYFNTSSIEINSVLSRWSPLELQWEVSQQSSKKFVIYENKVVRKTASLLDNRHRQVISESPLPSEGKFVITFKILKYGKSNPYDSIYIGLITKKHKTNDYSDGRTPGSLAYLTFPDNFADDIDTGKGTVLMDGKQISYGTDLFIRQGGQLKLELNLTDKQLTWDNGRKKIQLNLGAHYSTKPLYLFVSLCSDQSSISWKTEDSKVWA